MAEYKTEAILLGAQNWGEADKIAHFFSSERGRVKAAAFGCRRPKSPMAGALQLFNVLDATFMEGDRVDTLKRCSVKRRFSCFEKNIESMAYAALVAECVILMTAEGEPQPEVYKWLLNIFSSFEFHTPRIVSLAALVQLLMHCGIGLSYNKCVISGGEIKGDAKFSTEEGGAVIPEYAGELKNLYDYPDSLRQFFLTLEKLDWDSPVHFSAKRSDVTAAEKIIIGYISGTTGRSLRSLKFLRQIGA